jgi:hypothetical protein
MHNKPYNVACCVFVYKACRGHLLACCTVYARANAHCQRVAEHLMACCDISNCASWSVDHALVVLVVHSPHAPCSNFGCSLQLCASALHACRVFATNDP